MKTEITTRSKVLKFGDFEESELELSIAGNLLEYEQYIFISPPQANDIVSELIGKLRAIGRFDETKLASPKTAEPQKEAELQKENEALRQELEWFINCVDAGGTTPAYERFKKVLDKYRPKP